MSQKDNFAEGFFAGAIVGSVIGGLLGAALASRRSEEIKSENPSLLSPSKSKKLDSEESIEVARRNLEDKIAQLNLAIDDVRQQLGSVNNNVVEKESS